MEQVTATRREAELSDATSTDPATKEVRAKPWGNNVAAESEPDWIRDVQTLVENVLWVLRNRASKYGSPLDNHAIIAGYETLRTGWTVTPEDVCLLNVSQKMARDAHETSWENRRDLIGWLLLAELHRQRREKEENLATDLEDDH